MAQSTRGGRTGRPTMIDVFSPRRSGPWAVLRPMFRGWGLVVTVALSVATTAILHLDGRVVLIVLGALFIVSFAVVWHTTGLLIRARAALTVAAVLVAVNMWLRSMTTMVVGNIVLVCLLVALVAIPVTGRFLITRAWCVLDRHRLRACLRMAKVRTMNLDGSLPLMLWARPTNTGERVWLWIRAGSAGDDIEDALPYISAACYAREARLHRVRKLTTLVAVDIIRRDPLGTGEKIPSPLAQLASLIEGRIAGEGTEAIRPVSVADITTTESLSVLPEQRKSARKTTTPAAPETPAVVVSGEDLSDYVD